MAPPDFTGRAPRCSTGTGSMWRSGGRTSTLSWPPKEPVFEVLHDANKRTAAVPMQTTDLRIATMGHRNRRSRCAAASSAPAPFTSGLSVTRASWCHLEIDIVGALLDRLTLERSRALLAIFFGNVGGGF